MTTSSSTQIEKQAQTAADRLAKAKLGIAEVVYGQDRVVDLTLAALLSGGHTLLVGVPGLAKTLLVETLATVMGLDNKRVQFTPDLMPADIIGSEVLEEGAKGKRSFRFIQGPAFTQLLMADEINRASPRTQSALLQAMQEKFVTVAGARHDLPAPFHVLATQNPIEQEGTYPLPEAQLDRFLLQVNVEFPDLDTERTILLATTGASEAKAKKVITPDQSDFDFVKNHVSWGPGPRAGQALMLATRAKALIEGRLSPSVDDVIDLASPVLRHRMAISFAARAEGETVEGIISKLKATL